MHTTLRRSPRVAAITLAAAAALVVAACQPPAGAEDEESSSSDDGSSENADGGTFTVGLIGPMTGAVASSGQEMQQGWDLYWEINGNEVNGITVETLVEDDAGVPETALSKATLLVESENVDLIVGPLQSHTALAVAAYASEAGVPNFEAVSAADDLTQRLRNDYVLRTGSMGGSQVAFVAGDWSLSEGHRSAITLCPDYAYGWESCAGFVSTFTEGGGEIVDQLWVPNGTADFSPYISQIQASGADMVFVTLSGGADGPNFLGSFNDFGVGEDIALLMNGFSSDQATIRAMGESVLGINSVNFWVEGLDTPEVNELVDAYSEAYDGNLPSTNVAGGYTTAMVVAATLEEVGLVGPEEFVAAARGLSLPATPYGPLEFDEYNNVVLPVYVREIVEMDDGTIRNVAIETYDEVSQFWTYDPEEFLAGDPFSRDNNGQR
ncbi:MAG: ABC transporter substrate-binding protein [Beutenbergiaceae bacterium]